MSYIKNKKGEGDLPKKKGQGLEQFWYKNEQKTNKIKVRQPLEEQLYVEFPLIVNENKEQKKAYDL